LPPDIEAWEEVNKLKALLFLPHVNMIGARLLETIEGLAINEKIEIYRRIDSLAQRLREPTYNIDVSILMIANKEQLSGILIIKEQLRNIKTILILPDREYETLSKGHELYPRFISFIDGDFKDVGAVLEKMIKNKQGEQRTKISEIVKVDKIREQ
jgi:hypothetical protein